MTRALTLVLGIALVSSATLASADSRIPKRVVRRTDGRPASARTTPPQPSHGAAARTAAHPAGLPLWSDSFVRDGVAYPYTMVGRDPVRNPGTTTVRAVIVPIRFVFEVQGDLSSNVFDSGVDLVDGQTAIAGILKSPIFTPYPFTIGGQNVGTTQFADAYMRANVWSALTPARDPHFLLAPEIAATRTIAVPADDALEGCDGDLNEATWTCSGVWRAFVPMDFLNAQLATVIDGMHATPDVLPIFVLGGVVTAEGPLGAHWVAGNQTWIWASYLSQSAFGGSYPDVSALGHEVLEWLNDPFAVNNVPGWPLGPAFYSDWCYARTLEVADPLEDDSSTAAIPFAVDAFTYHLPDAVFLDYYTHKSSRAAGGLYSLFGGAPGPSPACVGDAVYSTTPIAVPGALQTVPNGINDSGDVVGYFFDQSSTVHAFVAEHGRFSPIDIQGAAFTIPSAINDLGQIAGYFVAGGRPHGFIRTGATVQVVDVPGAIATLVTNLNRFGDVVGEYVNGAGQTHGFVSRNGAFATVDVPNAAGTVVTGINDRGDLSLIALDGAGAVRDSYRRIGGVLSPVRFPGNTTPTQVSAIDNQDRVVGSLVSDFWGTVDGFVTRASGEYVRMPLTFQINGMNNHGDVVGFRDGSGFIATFPGGAR